MVDSFEDKKDQGPMTLWLLLNFPLVWCNIPQTLLKLDDNQLQFGGADDGRLAESSAGSDHEYKDPYYKKCEVLVCLFPLNKFILLLDNMCR